jgi:hypothetical protein
MVKKPSHATVPLYVLTGVALSQLSLLSLVSDGTGAELHHRSRQDHLQEALATEEQVQQPPRTHTLTLDSASGHREIRRECKVVCINCPASTSERQIR